MRPVSAFAKVGIFALVLGAIGAVGAALWLPDWFPPAAGVEAQRQDTLYLWLLVTSSIIFAVVVSFLGYSMWKFRARPGDMSDGAPIHGHTGLEIVWTIVPIVIVLSFAVAATVVLNRNESLKHGHMVVNVTGKQFAWSFTYPKRRGHLHCRDPGAAEGPPDRVPPARPTHGRDPQLLHPGASGSASDVVPGIRRTVVATPTRLGTYAIVCAELCGIGHSQMRNILVVMKPADFAKWLGDAEEARGEAAALVRRNVRRGGDLQERRVQRLSHLHPGRIERDDRPESEQPGGGRDQVRRGRDGRAVRPRVDHRPQ